LDAEPPIIELDGVRTGYLPEVDVLRGVTMAVRKATITSIIGANGAGKSTVLRFAFGFLGARAGRLRFRGEDVTGWRPQQALKHGVAYVAQGRCNFPAMTVRENLDTAAYTRRDREVASDINEIMERFPVLREKQREVAGNLSGGQQQILEMAMGLMNRPKLLLIDEPTLGLSPKMFDEVFSHIQRCRSEGVTVLMVEQNAARALEISDYAFVLRLGEKWLEGTGAEILNNPVVREQYLGGQ
jgi:branched-chain amino acid transport system ATP-binding protein